MRYLTMLLLTAAATYATGTTPSLFEFQADIEVAVTHAGAPLADASVRLDLNNNGIWDDHLGEPEAATGADGLATFNDIVSIHDPERGGDHPADIIDWQTSRILTGNLRGAVGTREVQFDFSLPAGVARVSLGLYDLRGRLLARTDGVGDLALDVPGGLSSGVYFVRLSADPAAPVTQRITSVGQRTQTILAREVSTAVAVAAGWAEFRAPAGTRKCRDGGHSITIMVSHAACGGMNQAETVAAGQNDFAVAMPESPAGFVYIPPGRFVMGSPEGEPGRVEHEGPQHEVEVTQGFIISRHEVTEQWWYQVMGGTPTTSQLPKSHVSWDMAVQFCNALSNQEALTPAYTIHGSSGNVTWNQNADGYRLPTEAEWEYACRATTTMAYHNNTNCLSSHTEANYWGSLFQLPGCPQGVYRGARTAVGTFPANRWGLADMHGNLWEWVWCGWRTYTSSPQANPVTNASPGAYRVYRGGSWDYYARDCRSAYRYSSYPDQAYGFLGFRPVR